MQFLQVARKIAPCDRAFTVRVFAGYVRMQGVLRNHIKMFSDTNDKCVRASVHCLMKHGIKYTLDHKSEHTVLLFILPFKNILF